ncbi:ROK family protein [Verrucomicrobium sp. 3C]|uniref:ROK family protein n=1 Tax=Verrucomicrobium sp. 3C TaxID=1134055 RepID=UPI0004784CF3|nr:ROK family protein [Verrucomicrobium sp. 3C]
MSEQRIRIGIDLGGTKIEILVLKGEDREMARRRIPTPTEGYEAILEAVRRLVMEVEKELGLDPLPLGIASPGSLSEASGLLKNSNTVCLCGRALQTDLEGRLARPVRIANDANCFALSEASDGMAKGESVVFGVILGTGVGGGLVIDGRILSGANGIAGEWGHNPLPWVRPEELPGPECYCGKQGCIETFLSGPGMASDHERVSGIRLSPEAIVQRAACGDPGCEATLLRYEERLARGLAHVINLLDPGAIVLGGGLSNVKRLYRRVPALWSRWIFSDQTITKLVPPRHGDSSGVRGAARLWDPPSSRPPP